MKSRTYLFLSALMCLTFLAACESCCKKKGCGSQGCTLSQGSPESLD